LPDRAARARGEGNGRGGSSAPPISFYYLATPLFAALDLWAGLPVRAVGLESTALRLGYYALVFALGFVMRARPPLAPVLALVESAGNLTLLMAAVLIPIWSLPETLDGGAAAELPARVLNLVLSGSVLVYAFYKSQAQLQGRR
jgi:hypothetical protein